MGPYSTAQPKPEPAISVERAKHSAKGTFFRVLPKRCCTCPTRQAPWEGKGESPRGTVRKGGGQVGGGGRVGGNSHIFPNVQKQWYRLGVPEIKNLLLASAIH